MEIRDTVSHVFYWEFCFSIDHLFSLTGCWIKSEFKTEQIVTEYLWVWMAALLMAILYTIMFIVMRGWFIIDNGVHWYTNYGQRQPTEVETEEEQESKAIANLMLL